MIIRPNNKLSLQRKWLEKCWEQDILPPRLKKILITPNNPNKGDYWDRLFTRE